MTTEFANLSYAGRLRRVRVLAESALARWDLAVARLQFLVHRGSTLYRVTAEDGTRYVLRLYGHPGPPPAAMESQLQWVAALRREAGLGVPAPLPAKDGALFAEVGGAGVAGPRVAALLDWVDGRFYDAGLTPAHLRRVGGFMARLHAQAAQYVPPPGFSRGVWNPQRFLAPGSLIGEGTPPPGVSPADSAIFPAVRARIAAALPLLDRGPGVYGLIHADLQQTNYLFAGDEVRAIDFDDCCWGYFLYDMAIPLFELADRPQGAAMRTAFFEGYTAVRPLPADAEAGITLFTALRLVKRVNYLLGSDDPHQRPRAAYWLDYTARWLRAWLAT